MQEWEKWGKFVVYKFSERRRILKRFMAKCLFLFYVVNHYKC